MTDEIIVDSPTGWVRSHIDDYVATDGKKGHRWRGLPTLLLTTRGRKSGQLRRTALIYGRDGDNFLVVASNGGAKKHPLWYLNLIATPEVTIQVGPDIMQAHARTADPEERERLWPVMSAIFPTCDSYQTKAGRSGREVPLIIIEPDISASEQVDQAKA